MSLTEYINQTDPQKLPIGSVKLETSEYRIFAVEGEFSAIGINLYPAYSYVKKADSEILYTQDQHGNPKNATVFSI